MLRFGHMRFGHMRSFLWHVINFLKDNVLKFKSRQMD